MKPSEFLAERKRLQGQIDLATKHGDTVLAESIGRRMAALKASHPELANDTIKAFSTIAESRREKLNEDSDKITKFLDRLTDDLGVHPSLQEDPNTQTKKHDLVARGASQGQPVYLFVGDLLVAILSFSTDADNSRVKAQIDDEQDRQFVRAYQLAKNDFFEEVEEAKYTEVKMKSSFGSAKNYEKASDFTAALEKMFGATAFQTKDEGTRSFMMDETGMKRMQAFMRREGIELEAAVDASQEAEPAQDEAGNAGEETKVRFNGMFSKKMIDELRDQFGAYGFGKNKDGSKSFAIKGAFSVERLKSYMSKQGYMITLSEAVSESEISEVEDGFTLTADMVEPELDSIYKMHGGKELEVTFMRLTKTDQISFYVGEFDGRGDKRPQDMHAKVTVGKDNKKAAAAIAKHFKDVTFMKGESMAEELESDEEELNEEVPEEMQEFAKKLQAVWMKYFKNGTAFATKAALGSDSFFISGFLIGTREDQISKIWNNDPLHHTFMITKEGDNYVIERSQGSISIKPPEGSYLAMGSVKVPYRKAKGDEKKIITAFDRYVKRLRAAFDDNKDNIYQGKNIDPKYFESMNEENLNEEGLTEKEAIRLAKKAMKATGEQQEALYAVLNNGGYRVKEIDGKKKLMKKGSDDVKASLESLLVEGLGNDVKKAILDTYAAGYGITPNSNKGENGGIRKEAKLVLAAMVIQAKKPNETNFVMTLHDASGKMAGQVQVDFRRSKVEVFKLDDTMTGVWKAFA